MTLVSVGAVLTTPKYDECKVNHQLCAVFYSSNCDILGNNYTDNLSRERMYQVSVL